MKLRDRITGVELEGDWSVADPLEYYPACPECGAEEHEPCTASDPERPGFGVELASYVHTAREAAL